jgi:serine/threonine protein kinase, bacterial
VVLPFTGLNWPAGVAVDVAGNLYLTQASQTGRVLKLPAGSVTQIVLPFTGLSVATGVAVDSAGNLYVTEEGGGRVLKLPASSATQEVLPFTDLESSHGVAVDAAGNLYVTDRSKNVQWSTLVAARRMRRGHNLATVTDTWRELP